MEDELFSRTIHSNDNFQVRLTVHVFREVEYLSLRKYYLDFDETWKHSNEGISMPLDMNNSKELFTGLVEILSLAESKEVILEHFSDLIKDTYQDERLSGLREPEVL